jgi:hypothetical protein
VRQVRPETQRLGNDSDTRILLPCQHVCCMDPAWVSTLPCTHGEADVLRAGDAYARRGRRLASAVSRRRRGAMRSL